MWGAALRPGREKFSLHPRHVRWTCQLNDAVESSGYALTYSGLPVARLSRVLFSVLCSRGRFGPSGLHAPFSWAQSAPFLHPRHVCDVPKDDAAGDSGDSGDAGARDKAIAGQRNQAFKFPTFQLYVLPAVAGP